MYYIKFYYKCVRTALKYTHLQSFSLMEYYQKDVLSVISKLQFSSFSDMKNMCMIENENILVTHFRLWNHLHKRPCATARLEMFHHLLHGNMILSLSILLCNPSEHNMDSNEACHKMIETRHCNNKCMLFYRHFLV